MFPCPKALIKAVREDLELMIDIIVAGGQVGNSPEEKSLGEGDPGEEDLGVLGDEGLDRPRCLGILAFVFFYIFVMLQFFSVEL